MAQHALAVLVDFENMARPGARSRGDFDIRLVLDRLNEKGRVIVKRAYADWSRYREAKHQLQNAGLELIEMPSAREGAKNRADIKLAVDAMELAYSREHVTNFVIVSGDSDFTPLVGKLRELDKRVTGVGNRDSSSELLIANCDEFIFYDTISGGGSRNAPSRGTGDAASMLRDTLTALQREGIEWPLASIVKDSMRRKNPAFDERDLGFSTFSKLLEDASTRGLVRLESDPRSGTYRVELGDSSAQPPEGDGPSEDRGDDAPGRRRRRRRRVGEPAEGNGAPVLGDVPDGAEVFEVVVSPTVQDLADLPPVGEPISYEDVILLGGEVEAEIPTLIEPSDLERIGSEQPSRGSRRRRRRFTNEAEPTASDLEQLSDDDDDLPAPAVASSGSALTLEPMSADAIRAAFEAGETVRFTVEGVEHTSADSLGTATLEGDEVIRAWTNADGKAERRPSKSLDAGVKFLAAGRKGAFRAVAIATEPAPGPVVADVPAEAADSPSEAPSDGRRRRRRRPSGDAAGSETAAVEPAAAEAPAAEAGASEDSPGRRRRRRTARPAE